ncbi:MAG: class I SAM-dependent methyltransferase [Bacteroidota bacterium]|nr:class I SAM-dependent methyltransferase [Rhodothermia bacterium]MDW8285011.1 class I SAM-dependent methyltransferase [Bacteroidota bacterium]
MNFNQVSIELVRNFWNTRPCNIRHSIKPVGTREYFDEVEKRKYFVEPHIIKFAEFPRWNGKKVLEIGCGIGTDSINFARHGAQVTAVELSEKSLEIAQVRAKIYGLEDRIRFVWANAEELSQYLPPEPFDLIYSFGVIHHTPHPERVLEQLNFYCHSDTVIKIMLYNRYSWKVLWILMVYGKGRLWKLDQLIAQYSEAQTGCPVTYTFTRSQVLKLLKKYNFEINDIWIDHIFPYRVREYIKHQYVKVWYFRWLPHPIFKWLEKHFGWHICVTAKRINDNITLVK